MKFVTEAICLSGGHKAWGKGFEPFVGRFRRCFGGI